MKRIFTISIICSFLLAFAGCEKWDADEKPPQVSISVSPQNPKVGEEVTVTINTDAEYLSIFTGDEGHKFENSHVRYQMEYGDLAFKDTVYAEKISEGYDCIWKRTMADYASVEDVLKDFEFFGAVENIELGEFERPACSMMDMTHKKVLKFSITDRNTVSGFKFKPNIHLFNWDIFYEMRLVPCKEDSLARFNGRNNKEVHALFNMTLEKVEDGSKTVLSGDTWNGSGPWCWDYFFYVYQTYEPMLPPRQNGAYNEFHSVRSRMMNENNYGYYHPEEYRACEMKIGFGWPRQPWENGDDFQVDENGFPKNLSNYKGFQGDVYIDHIQWGQDVYKSYDTGVSLGSVYTGEGLTTTYTYKYDEAGEFDIVVVGTNVGRKEYSGDGYQTERESYDAEYKKHRSKAKVTIKVSE